MLLFRCLRTLLCLFAAFCSMWPRPIRAQHFSDFKLRYSLMSIEQATLQGIGSLDLDFYRHNLETEIGLGQAFIGLTYQYATKEKQTGKFGNSLGKIEDGLMLTAGYNFIFSNQLRLDTYGRAGIWGNTNPAQALYATETDLRIKLILFDVDGTGLLSRKAIFPSAHIGTNVNQYGRVQALGGFALWWNGFGLQADGFYAFNGVEDVFNPGKDGDKIFAHLKNSGVGAGIMYEFHDLQLWVRQNLALQNGGHDFTASLQYQHFFSARRPSHGKN